MDRLLELLSPMPKQAEAAPWKEVFPELLEIARKVLEGGKAGSVGKLAIERGMNPRSVPYKALERMTEEVQPVQRAGFYHWNPGPGQLAQRAAQGKPELPLGRYHPDFHGIELIQPSLVKAGANPFATYAHEGGHAWHYGGNPELSIDDFVEQWMNKVGFEPSRYPGFARDVRRSAEEGFASGVEQGLISQKTAPEYGSYYHKGWKGSEPWQRLYFPTESLGRGAAESVVKGKPMGTRDIWEQLLDIVDRRYLNSRTFGPRVWEYDIKNK